MLLAHVLGVSRLDLYLRYDQPLAAAELARFKALVVRRRQGEPVAYLTGHKEFWSLDFLVTPAVLIPRPETEVLVAAGLEAARDWLAKGVEEGGPEPAPPSLSGQSASTPTDWGLEVGVGSGAVAVALARELPQMVWVALDVSLAALQLARQNAQHHEVARRLKFLQADLLKGLKPGPRFALLVANLPYVCREAWEQLPKDIRDFEPREALWGGEDGLDFIRPLARTAHNYLRSGGWLALEVGFGQAQEVRRLLEETQEYDRLDLMEDYQRVPRVVRGRRRRAG